LCGSETWLIRIKHEVMSTRTDQVDMWVYIDRKEAKCRVYSQVVVGLELDN